VQAGHTHPPAPFPAATGDIAAAATWSEIKFERQVEIHIPAVEGFAPITDPILNVNVTLPIISLTICF